MAHEISKTLRFIQDENYGDAEQSFRCNIPPADGSDADLLDAYSKYGYTV